MSRFLAAVSFMLTVIGCSTVFFRFVEGWSWIDSYFFTVVTLSTVGYGEHVPATVVGKLGTTVLIFVGVGAFAYAITQFGTFAVRRRLMHRGWLLRKLTKEEIEDRMDD